MLKFNNCPKKERKKNNQCCPFKKKGIMNSLTSKWRLTVSQQKFYYQYRVDIYGTLNSFKCLMMILVSTLMSHPNL